MDFDGKVCIVTGGSSGIGKATAQKFASAGAFVGVVGRNRERGEAVVLEMGSRALFLEADVGFPEQIKSSIEEVLKRWGRVDILVNNAGMMIFDNVESLKAEDWDRVLKVNLYSVFYYSKYCLPHIVGGAIINVSSVHAHESTADVSSYAASKAGIEAFTRALSLECKPSKVRVNCVAPGAINTEMLWNNPGVDKEKNFNAESVGEPEDVANAICFLASDKARFIHGTTLVVDGGRLNIL
jgi:glucose 1-dehydrogenase